MIFLARSETAAQTSGKRLGKLDLTCFTRYQLYCRWPVRIDWDKKGGSLKQVQ